MDDNRTSLHLSLPPHLRLPADAGSVTGDLLIALAPALILAVIHYGVRAAVLILTCMLVSAALTALFELIARRGRSGDVLYAAACGALCALFFGAGCPVWLSALCGALCALAGLPGVWTGRRTLFHPALCAYLIALALFPEKISACTPQLDGFRSFFSMTAGEPAASSAALLASGEKLSPFSLFMGEGVGMLGGTDPLALLIGFGYLLLRHIAVLRAPLCAFAAFFLCALFFPAGASPGVYACALTLSGGFLTGLAFFLFPLCGAPMSRRGQAIFGLGYGLGCFLLRRIFGADGAVTALVFLQPFVFRLDCLQSAPALRASRFGARIEALILRSAHTRRDTAYRGYRRRAPQNAAPEIPAQEIPAQPFSADDIPADAFPEEEVPIEDILPEELPEEPGPGIPEFIETVPDEPGIHTEEEAPAQEEDLNGQG